MIGRIARKPLLNRLNSPLCRIRNRRGGPGRTQRVPRRRARTRRGVFSLQLIFIIPVLLLVIVAAVQYGIWSVARQTVASSAIDGSRVAAANGTMKEIVKAVDKSLAANKMRVTPRGSLIIVERFGLKPAISGNAELMPRSTGPKLRPGEVRVTVCVRPGSRVPVWVWWSKTEPRLQSSSLLAAR